MHKIMIMTTKTNYEFVGKHLPERETPNWHYYETVDGKLYHFRKEHMVVIIDDPLEE